jgi:hypothetical protein
MFLATESTDPLLYIGRVTLMLSPSPLHPLSAIPSTHSRCQYGHKVYSLSPSHSFSFHKIRYKDTYPSCRTCSLRCPPRAYSHEPFFFFSQTLFAAAAAPSCSIFRLHHIIFWLWVHALQLALANQTLPRAIAEDTLNHSDRPLPAGRMSVHAARTLRWVMVPLCFLLSAAYGPRTALASLGASLFMLAYNEGGGAGGHWFIRNALNAVGYAVAEAGATFVACACHLIFFSVLDPPV